MSIDIDPDVLDQYMRDDDAVDEKAAHKKKYRVVVLTSRNESERGPTSEKLRKAAEDRGHLAYVVGVESAYVRIDDGRLVIHNRDDDKGFPVSADDTVVFPRRSVIKNSYTLNLLSRLEKHSIFCVNYRDTIETCEDKYRTTLRLVDAGLSCPPTVLLPNEDFIDSALEQIGGRKFPVVVKTLSGTQGIGVFIVDSYRSLRSIMQTIWKLGSRNEVILQKYVDTNYDVRVHVVGDRVLGAMKRIRVDDDFRTNYSLGGDVKKVKITPEQAEVCVRAAKAVGALWAGVDFVLDKKGDPYLLEVNTSPGTDGIEEVTERDIAGEVLDFFLDEKNWRYPVVECGGKEVIHVVGVGDLVARLDTGNLTRSCSVHAEDISVSDDRKKVTWRNGDKKFESDVVSFAKIKSNVDDKQPSCERPVVLLDVVFNGIKYFDVPFNLNERTHKKCKVLLNTRFMERAGIIVNPAHSFLVTVDPKKKEEEEDYSA
jgi:ribosomal protein S6--L-glutamate ligase